MSPPKPNLFTLLILTSKAFEFQNYKIYLFIYLTKLQYAKLVYFRMIYKKNIDKLFINYKKTP